MYDPKTVSEMLDIPGSTLRRYSADYSDLLSENARLKGRKRRYTDSDVLILRKIRELTRSRKTQDEIRQVIQVTDFTKDEGRGSALALIPEIASEFEFLHQVQANTKSQVEGLDERMGETESQLSSLRAYVRQVAEWESLSWWERRRTPKPKPPE